MTPPLLSTLMPLCTYRDGVVVFQLIGQHVEHLFCESHAMHTGVELYVLGIGLYGISPLPYPVPALRPVAALHTAIISLKHWPAGTHIGYGGRGQTMRPSIIATIPVGYADGINRHLGCGKASFVVNGVECPTIGNICMDQCMIDVTDAPDVAVGDTVEIFG